MSEILDSGARTTFPSGSVRDIAEGKGRCDLLPLSTVADFLEYVATQPRCLVGVHPLDMIGCYITGPHESKDSYLIYNALLTFCLENFWDVPTMLMEVSKHFEDGAKKYGERNWEKGIPLHCYVDSAVRHYLKWTRRDDDERHDRAFCWNLLCLLWTEENRPECNDIWDRE